MPEGYPADQLSPSYRPELAMRGMSRGGDQLVFFYPLPRALGQLLVLGDARTAT